MLHLPPAWQWFITNISFDWNPVSPCTSTAAVTTIKSPATVESLYWCRRWCLADPSSPNSARFCFVSHTVQGHTSPLCERCEIIFFYHFPRKFNAQRDKVTKWQEKYGGGWGDGGVRARDCSQSSHIIQRRVPLFSGLSFPLVFYFLHAKKNKKCHCFSFVVLFFVFVS